MAGKRAEAKKITAAERRIQALELRKRGKSYREIAAELRVTHTTIRKDIQKALDDLNKEERVEVAGMRRLIHERLEMAIMAIAAEMLKGNLWAVDRWIALNEQIGRLWGVYEQPDYALVLSADVVGLLQKMGVTPSEVSSEFEEMVRRAATSTSPPPPLHTMARGE